MREDLGSPGKEDVNTSSGDSTLQTIKPLLPRNGLGTGFTKSFTDCRMRQRFRFDRQMQNAVYFPIQSPLETVLASSMG